MPSILIVDDMAIFREPIAATLRMGGFETTCASDGMEALASIRTKQPDLVLLDLAMPRLDGFGVLRHLRDDPATANLPVVLLTASSEKESVLKAASLGVGDYLLKSRFSSKELLERVRRCLAHSVMRQNG